MYYYTGVLSLETFSSPSITSSPLQPQSRRLRHTCLRAGHEPVIISVHPRHATQVCLPHLRCSNEQARRLQADGISYRYLRTDRQYCFVLFALILALGRVWLQQQRSRLKCFPSRTFPLLGSFSEPAVPILLASFRTNTVPGSSSLLSRQCFLFRSRTDTWSGSRYAPSQQFFLLRTRR